MRQAGKLSVCVEDYLHAHLQSNASSSCLYLMRAERDAAKYVARVWKELDYAQRDRLTEHVEKRVLSFMERLTTAIGEKTNAILGDLTKSEARTNAPKRKIRTSSILSSS